MSTTYPIELGLATLVAHCHSAEELERGERRFVRPYAEAGILEHGPKCVQPVLNRLRLFRWKAEEDPSLLRKGRVFDFY